MVRKRGWVNLVLLFSISILFLTSFVSADVFLVNQPDSVYNLQDTLRVSLGSDGKEGWAGVNLVCGQQDKMLFFKYIKDTSNSEINAPLTKDFLRGTIGDCKLVLSFNGKKTDSFNFKISDKVNVDAVVEGTEFNPGDNVFFSGSALKENGLLVDGSADIMFSASNLEFLVPLVGESFEGNFSLPENLAAGEYKVTVFVSEKDSSGNVTNFGSTETSVKVKQLPTKLVLDSPQTVTPGNEMAFKADLYDQTNQLISDYPVTFILKDVNGSDVLNKLGSSGKQEYFIFGKNSPYGSWKLSSEVDELFISNDVYVDKYMEAEFAFANGTLVVRNIGNIPYDRKVEMRIGNYTNVTQLNIGVGKSLQFDLSAPDGTYEVGVSDGSSSGQWSDVALTGNAISFGGSKKGFSFFGKTFLAWFLLVAILGLLIFGSSVYVVKKKKSGGFSKAGNGSLDKPLVLSGDISAGKSGGEKGGVVNLTPTRTLSGISKQPVIEKHSDIAMPSSSIDGAKQSASVIAIKIKNYAEIVESKSNAMESVKKIVSEISSNEGRVYKNNDFIVGIFAPIVTKTFENSLTAAKVAKDITHMLNSHNDKFTQKINFGIGIHEGEIIAKKEEGKLLFSPLGNSLIGAKKVAEIAERDVLLTEEANKKVIGKVKTSLNPDKFGIRSYSINDIVDRDKNKKFIEGFLHRNQEFKTLRDYKSGK